MKNIMFGAAALCAAAVATPVVAQGVYVDAPGVHLRAGSDYGYRHEGYRAYGYRDHDRDGWRWRHRPGFYAYGSGGCREVIIRRQRWDGTMVIRRIQRCG